MALSRPLTPIEEKTATFESPLFLSADRIIDISVELRPDMPVYAQDLPVRFDDTMNMDRGDWVNLTTLHLNTHVGTHFDALHHVLNNGQMMGDYPLTRFIGPARVIDVGQDVYEIGPAHLKPHDIEGVKRLLVKTKASSFWQSHPATFRQDFPAFTQAGAQYLADAGIELIGIDYLSVELYDVPELPAHKAFMNAGITILEGINLSHVKPGDYTLVALPLKLDALDGTPGRAVLLQ
ncbi:MAG: cyclase family protein [Vampirovibrionales bacterium]